MPDSSIAITAGAGTNVDTITTPGGDHRQVVISASDRGGYTGRAATFRTPGRAATSHKILALHNATGSTVLVDVHLITIDSYSTVARPVAVPPPIFRLSRFTELPTGTVLAKVGEDTALTSSASVTAWQDASADGTSGTALTITVPASSALTQEIGARLITAAGYEVADRIEFLAGDSHVTLRALEGVVLEVVSPAGTSEPITDMFVASMQWEEYAA